jgi:hypothetical protein
VWLSLAQCKQLVHLIRSHEFDFGAAAAGLSAAAAAAASPPVTTSAFSPVPRADSGFLPIDSLFELTRDSTLTGDELRKVFARMCAQRLDIHGGSFLA